MCDDRKQTLKNRRCSLTRYVTTGYENISSRNILVRQAATDACSHARRVAIRRQSTAANATPFTVITAS